MEEKNQKAREIAKQISQFQDVDECIVDDWNKYGSFSLICYLNFRGKRNEYYPNNRVNFQMKEITNSIRKIKRERKGLHINIVDVPQRQYQTVYYQKDFVGYDSNYITIDVDVP